MTPNPSPAPNPAHDSREKTTGTDRGHTAGPSAGIPSRSPWNRAEQEKTTVKGALSGCFYRVPLSQFRWRLKSEAIAAARKGRKPGASDA